MRRLIAIALSLLCIVLPLRSVADAAASGQNCPMMQAEMHADMHAEMDGLSAAPADIPGVYDCCNDADTFASTGQLCKMGQECSPPMTYLVPPTMLQVGVAAQYTVVTAPPITLHTRPPAAVWRPPSLT